MALIIFITILLFSAILHEIAHGAVAEYFGDDTARNSGRITLNPIPHIDPYFSILIPLLLYFSGSPILFGAARPVPVNYYNLRNFRWGVFWVSAAGVITNLFLAFAFTLPLRLFEVPFEIAAIFKLIAEINIFLAIVNMIPIPPIDGSKMVAALIGEGAINKLMAIEMRGIIGILPFFILIYLLFSTSAFHVVMLPIANFFFRLFGI